MASMIAAGLVREPEPIRLPDLYEVIDGEIVELPPMSYFAASMGSRLLQLIGQYVDSHDLGRAVNEAMFRLEDFDRSRRPDVMFFSYARWPKEELVDPDVDAVPVIPDLAVEIVSKSDIAEDLIEKLQEYFQVGVRVVWVIYPKRGIMYVYESMTQVRGLTRSDILDGGDVLSGFQLELATYLPEPHANRIRE